MTEPTAESAAIVKLYCSVTVLIRQAADYSDSIARSSPEMAALLGKIAEDGAGLAAALDELIRQSGRRAPDKSAEIESESSLRPRGATGVVNVLEDMIAMHEQMVRDVGFLLAVLDLSDAPKLEDLLERINRVNAQWAVALRVRLPNSDIGLNS